MATTGWEVKKSGFLLDPKGRESSASSSRGRGLKGVNVGKENPAVEAEFSGSAKLRNVVWLEIDKGVIDNKEVLSRSLTGRWGRGRGGGTLSDQPPDLISLKSWAQSNWMLKGNLHLALLGGLLILFKFEDAVEAERVLHSRVKWFKGKCLLLDWWSLFVGCVSQRTGRVERCG